MIWLILAVALLNLGLGYAAACCLGKGPPGLIEVWHTLHADLRCPGSATPGSADCSENAAEPPPDAPQAYAAELEPASAEEVEAREPAADEGRGQGARPLAAAAPDFWDLDEKYVESSVLKLNVALIESGIRADEIDAELRAGRGRLGSEKLRDCTRRFREGCEAYLRGQADAAERLCGRLRQTEGLVPMADRIETANRQQVEQIETAIGSLDRMDFGGDPDEAGRSVLAEMGRLRAVRHRIRDHHEAAFLAIARHEGRLDKIEPRLFQDPLTELPNRIGLESTLKEWFRQSRHVARRLGVALFDLDDFGAINGQHGPWVGDRILYRLAGLFRKHAGEHDLVGRFGGQRFLVVLSDVGPRAATKQVELLRQSIARTTFRHAESAIRLTACAGIVDTGPESTDEGTLERVESVLARAKEEGPDCSFASAGAGAERVESPNLGAEYVEIAI